MISLAIWANLVLQWGRGPDHNAAAIVEHDKCANSWWANLLYINNLNQQPESFSSGDSKTPMVRPVVVGGDGLISIKKAFVNFF